MATIEHTSAGGTRSTYRYEAGPITWDGQTLNAFVFGRLPHEGGKQISAIIVNRALLELPELAAGPWVIFAKAPPRMPVPEWELIGSGIGREPLLDGPAPGLDVPANVFPQLQALWGP